MIVAPLPPDRAALVWPQVEGFIARALKRANGERLPIDILAAVLRGDKLLWVIADDDRVIHAAAVTQIIDYPRKKTCQIVLLGGTGMKLWADDVRRELEAYARAMRCNAMECIGRKGWIRAGGYRQVAVVMMRDLS